jgi:hypothetical protein
LLDVNKQWPQEGEESDDAYGPGEAHLNGAQSAEEAGDLIAAFTDLQDQCFDLAL